ncbi:MAG: gamma-glutamylcyclotransferase [Alphaproteobacteria bacterium]|nr:gamma-glutamylcyclotransferase [Alphaproteobacteria bacterium]MBV8408254.1 gamma-glutamylcyclotransferase [Alphaproteobacteria bacterium]
MRFFFYGTLLDPDVMALVIGRRLPPCRYALATLPGFVRRRAKGASYPIVLSDRRAAVEGAVVGALSARDVGRLAAYEGPRYRIASRKVRMNKRLVSVSVFEPVERRFEPVEGRWDLAVWQRRDKRQFVERLRLAFSARPAYSRP